MDELCCSECGDHIGWIEDISKLLNDVFCDECEKELGDCDD